MATNDKAKVPTHPLVEALNPDPTKPPQQTTKLFGLPGPAPDAGTTRLWLDSSLSSYVDIPNKAILHSKTLPDDAGTVLWVAADAQLTHGSVSSHQTQASFLAGGITASHLAGAAAAGAAPIAPGLHPTPAVSAVLPCVSLPFCRSETMPPTHCCLLSHVPCPSTQCASLNPCITETCTPSHLGPCHSWPVLCPPTNVLPCPPTNVLPCPPTHVPPCPVNSVQVICHTTTVTAPLFCHPQSVQICPTPTAVGGCPSIACGGQVGGGGLAQ